ncbi:MAG: hypothetical protein HOW97_01095 [Catenulispora sp.]|nr:hypothetical protein [Catenulispora sp.]
MSTVITEDEPGRPSDPLRAAARRQGPRWQSEQQRRIAFRTGAVLASITLFTALYYQARSVAVHSDGAGYVLQARDMLHGNLFLHGWTTSDVTYLTTELPWYMLVEVIRGVNGSTVPTVAALNYTLIVILSVLAATGGSTGRERWIRGGLVAAALIAPAAGGVTAATELTSPDHFGTGVPVMAVYVLFDRAGKRRAVPYAVGALLVLFGIGDQLVLLVAAIPLALVAAARFLRPGPDRRFDGELALCAGAATPISLGLVALIHALGGLSSINPQFTLIDPSDIVPHAKLTGQCVLMLFSADFSGLPPGIKLASACYHLLAVAVAGYGVVAVLARLLARSRTRMEEAMVVGIVINLAAFMFTSLSTGDTLMGREISLVLPLAAVLGARVVGSRLAGFRWTPVGVACCVALSALSLTVHATAPRAKPEAQDVSSWLLAHKFHHGLGGYWRASIITMTTGDRVQVRGVVGAFGKIAADTWETRSQWYDPATNTANFLVIDNRPTMAGYGTELDALATFGKPIQRVVFKDGLVLIYDHDIMPQLQPPPPPPS